MMVYGTRATLRIDLRNKLILLSRGDASSGRFARGLRVTGSAFQIVLQTTQNAIGMALDGASTPGDPSHLIRSHYEALEQGHEVPAPIARARNTVRIARE